MVWKYLSPCSTQSSLKPSIALCLLNCVSSPILGIAKQSSMSISYFLVPSPLAQHSQNQRWAHFSTHSDVVPL